VAHIDDTLLWLGTHERAWEEYEERGKEAVQRAMDALSAVRSRAADAEQLRLMLARQEEQKRLDAEKALAERERAARVRKAQEHVAASVAACIGLPSQDIAAAIKRADEAQPLPDSTPEEWQAFLVERESAVVSLRGMHDAQVARELEQAEAKVKADRLAALEAAEAARERAAEDEARRKREAEARIEAERAAEAARAAAAQKAEADERLRQEREAWEAADKARIAAEQRLKDSAGAMLAALQQIKRVAEADDADALPEIIDLATVAIDQATQETANV
jgi:hypothetical protein